MEFSVFETAEKAASVAGAKLSSLISEFQVPALLLVSGGSAFGVLENVDTSVLSKNLTVGVLDERASIDDRANNFKQMMDTKFYERADRAGCTFINSELNSKESKLGGEERARELATRLTYEYNNWREMYPDGKVVVTQGIGHDGHTAGILPYPNEEDLYKELFEKGLFVGYDSNDKHDLPLRVTVTNKFFTGRGRFFNCLCCWGEKERGLEKCYE